MKFPHPFNDFTILATFSSVPAVWMGWNAAILEFLFLVYFFGVQCDMQMSYVQVLYAFDTHCLF